MQQRTSLPFFPLAPFGKKVLRKESLFLFQGTLCIKKISPSIDLEVCFLVDNNVPFFSGIEVSTVKTIHFFPHFNSILKKDKMHPLDQLLAPMKLPYQQHRMFALFLLQWLVVHPILSSKTIYNVIYLLTSTILRETYTLLFPNRQIYKDYKTVPVLD